MDIMGKMKEWLRQDMKYNPEKYNNPEPTKEDYKNNKAQNPTLKKMVDKFTNEMIDIFGEGDYYEDYPTDFKDDVL
jgi:hypothetical protein